MSQFSNSPQWMIDELNSSLRPKLNMSERLNTIHVLREIISEVSLSPRAGKYEALERANWMRNVGIPKLEELLKSLES